MFRTTIPSLSLLIAAITMTAGCTVGGTVEQGPDGGNAIERGTASLTGTAFGVDSALLSEARLATIENFQVLVFDVPGGRCSGSEILTAGGDHIVIGSQCGLLQGGTFSIIDDDELECQSPVAGAFLEDADGADIGAASAGLLEITSVDGQAVRGTVTLQIEGQTISGAFSAERCD
jgi:hypothetical protein